MASGANRSFVGAYLGTGAEQTITVPGFKPRYIKIFAAATGRAVENIEGLGDTAAARAGGILDATEAAAASFLTAAEGVTFVDGGFTVGTAATVNGDGLQYLYVCTD